MTISGEICFGVIRRQKEMERKRPKKSSKDRMFPQSGHIHGVVKKSSGSSSQWKFAESQWEFEKQSPGSSF